MQPCLIQRKHQQLQQSHTATGRPAACGPHLAEVGRAFYERGQLHVLTPREVVRLQGRSARPAGIRKVGSATCAQHAQHAATAGAPALWRRRSPPRPCTRSSNTQLNPTTSALPLP